MNLKRMFIRFFNPRTYKPGQIIKVSKDGEKIRLLKFIRYNNVYAEIYLTEFVDYPELGTAEIALHDTKLNHKYGFGFGQYVEVLNDK